MRCGSDDDVNRFKGISSRGFLESHCMIFIFKDSQGGKRRGQYAPINHESLAKVHDRSECKYILAVI